MSALSATSPRPASPALVPSPAGGGRAVALLRAGIPLSLLMDLAGSDPHSSELYTLEHAS